MQHIDTTLPDYLIRLRQRMIAPNPERDAALAAMAASCPDCLGTGNLPDRRVGYCHCVLAKQDAERRARALARSQEIMDVLGGGIPPLYEKYDVSDFPGDPAITAAMLRWIDAPYDVLMTGPNQTGKTTLACAALRAAIANGQTGAYFLAPTLTYKLRESQSHHGAASLSEVMEALQTVSLLVLDDIGMERPTEFVVETISTITEVRRAHQRVTIITSNLDVFPGPSKPGQPAPRIPAKTLDVLYGPRMISRLAGRESSYTHLLVQPWSKPKKDGRA